jgi:putative phage-type endonuclease
MSTDIELVEDDEAPEIVKIPDFGVVARDLEFGFVPTAMEDRRTYIGGSDAAAAIGESKWKDRYTLWEEKTGLVQPEDISGKDAVYWGTVLESIVAQEYARRANVQVRRVPRIIRHPKYPFMGAHLDRIIINTKGGLEIKTTGHEGEEWGEEGTDEVPRNYFIQVQHYMACTAREFFNIALLAGGQRFKLYHVERDEGFIGNLEALEAEFWNWVETRTPPPPETSDEANLRWPISVEGEVQASAEVIQSVAELARFKAVEKEAKEAQELMELTIKAALGDTGDTLMAGTRKLCTWKSQENKRVDLDLLRTEYPDLVKQFTEVKTSRVLRLTKQK